jgi:hypothetical protein
VGVLQAVGNKSVCAELRSCWCRLWYIKVFCIHVCILMVLGGEMREMLVAVACAGKAAAHPHMAKVQDSSDSGLGWWAAYKQWAVSLFVLS